MDESLRVGRAEMAVAPMSWAGGGCDGGSRTGREDELLPWSSCMAYALKLHHRTARRVLEPLTAVAVLATGARLLRGARCDFHGSNCRRRALTSVSLVGG